MLSATAPRAYGVSRFWPQAWTLHSIYLPTITSIPPYKLLIRGLDFLRPLWTPPPLAVLKIILRRFKMVQRGAKTRQDVS